MRPIAFVSASTVLTGSSQRFHVFPRPTIPTICNLLRPVVPSELINVRMGLLSLHKLCMASTSPPSESSSNRNNRDGRGRNYKRRPDRRVSRNRTLPPPPAGELGRECYRSYIEVGSEVYIVKKIHQRSGEKTKGIVSRLLTKSSYHPRGIKVMLENGDVGRVCRINVDTATDDIEGT
ncbi:hypothetical protein HJC23_000073 [Cyclotella cryptica]|uniref:50S ribosomal protein L24, chloroplastic n=1 Tax=Cyclotella cryptica TaxID=29204 RepID=A0ABD3PHH1_9STRA